MSDKLQKDILCYIFKNQDLIKEALTHSSFESENEGEKSYERLEFLGDAILEAIISEELYATATDKDEGELTKMRAYIVCEKSLEEIANKMGLGQYIRFGGSEQQDNGFKKTSILADIVESIIAAVYLDSDFETARRFVLKHFAYKIKLSYNENIKISYKSLLQEELQKNGAVVIQYVTDYFLGPPHDREFFVSLLVDGKKIAAGSGKKKKEAEQNAAKSALERML